MMICEVQLYSQSQPIVHENVVNTYTKDGLFVIRIDALPGEHPTYAKFPVMHIFRIKEYQR